MAIDTSTEAVAECQRYLDYLDRQNERSRQLQMIAGKVRRGDVSQLEARKMMADLDDAFSVTVYDGALLADAIKVLIAATARAEAAEKRVRELEEALKALVGAVDDLISESEGVCGLHPSGDPAPWSELTAGGRFQEWLFDLETARAALKGDQS